MKQYRLDWEQIPSQFMEFRIYNQYAFERTNGGNAMKEETQHVSVRILPFGKSTISLRIPAGYGEPMDKSDDASRRLRPLVSSTALTQIVGSPKPSIRQP